MVPAGLDLRQVARGHRGLCVLGPGVGGSNKAKKSCMRERTGYWHTGIAGRCPALQDLEAEWGGGLVFILSLEEMGEVQHQLRAQGPAGAQYLELLL